MYGIMQCDTDGCDKEAVGTIGLGCHRLVFCEECHKVKRKLVTEYKHAVTDLDAAWLEKAVTPIE